MKKQITPLFLAIFCISLFSCSDNNTDEPIGDQLITLRVTIPQGEIADMNTPGSRAGGPVPGVGNEDKITRLKFFVFSNTTTLEAYREVEIKTDGTSDEPMWDATNQALRINVTHGAKEIYCLANWTDNGVDMPIIGVTDNTVALLTGKVRIHTSNLSGDSPVMTGYLQETISSGQTSVDIKLQRQFARVEFKFKVDQPIVDMGDKVEVTGVKFMKLASSSYVFPQTPISQPAGLVQWNEATFVDHSSGELTTTEADYGKLYYVPEYAPANESTATVMVIRAVYNGVATNPYYYSLVLDPSKSTTHPHAPFVIERNHTYRYTITITGAGSSTLPTRSNAVPGNANITYNLEIK